MGEFFRPVTFDPIAFPVTTPVTILGGYLGSGKTTLVNHLLRNTAGIRLAVLVNDFGDLAIDAELVEAEDGDVISLSGGCVCCSYGNDLSSALLTLQQSDTNADHIVIEASGVALPGSIANNLSLLRDLMLEGIVVIADAATIMKTAGDKYLSDTIEKQLAAADLVLLNKRDLLTEPDYDNVKLWLGMNFPSVRIVEAEQANVPANLILGSLASVSDRNSKSSFARHDASIFDSIEIQLDDEYDVSDVAQRLSDSKCGLLRAKGFARDIDGQTKTIQVVGKRWTVTTAPEKVSTGLVCIGKRGEFSERSVRHYLDLVEC